jgi:hypothetical protein
LQCYSRILACRRLALFLYLLWRGDHIFLATAGDLDLSFGASILGFDNPSGLCHFIGLRTLPPCPPPLLAAGLPRPLLGFCRGSLGAPWSCPWSAAGSLAALAGAACPAPAAVVLGPWSCRGLLGSAFPLVRPCPCLRPCRGCGAGPGVGSVGPVGGITHSAARGSLSPSARGYGS